MRWVVGILLLLAAAAGLFAWLHPRPQTIGERIKAAMEREHVAVRGAIPVMDFVPDEKAVAAVKDPQMKRGEGSVPGFDLRAGDAATKQWWLEAGDVHFVWRQVKREEQVLRAGFAEGGLAREAAKHYLGNVEYFADAVDTSLAETEGKVEGMADEELFAAWLQADGAELGQINELRRAVLEAELLLAREEKGPVVAFSRSGYSVYLLQGEKGEDVTWCEVDAFDRKGELAWVGVLKVDGEVTPEQLRNEAVWVTDEAIGK